MTDKQVEQELQELRRGDDAVAKFDWTKAAGAYRNAYGLAATDRASIERERDARVQALEHALELADAVIGGISTDNDQQVWFVGDHMALRIWDYQAARKETNS